MSTRESRIMTRRVNFDAYVERYDRLLSERTSFFASGDAYFAKYKVHLVREYLHGPVRRLLEYGCGTGRNIPFLRDVFPEASIVGTDISPASLEAARESNLTVEFHEERGGLLPGGAFDLIFVAGVFHHVPPGERARVAQVLAARAAPDCSLFVFEHNPYNPVTRHIVANCEYDADAILLKPGELKAYLSVAGFRHVRTRYCLLVPPRLGKLAVLERSLSWAPLGGQYFVQFSK